MASALDRAYLVGPVAVVITTHLDAAGESFTASDRQFNALGELLVDATFSRNGEARIEHYRYGKNSELLTHKRIEDANGNALGALTLLFETDIRLRVERSEDFETGPVETYFNKAGFEQRRIQRAPEGKVLSVREISRDPSGKPSNVVYRDRKGRVETEVATTWGRRGFKNTEEVRFLRGDEKGERVLIKYDDYKVDEQGNWTERSVTETRYNGKRVKSTFGYVEKRQIAYRS